MSPVSFSVFNPDPVLVLIALLVSLGVAMVQLYSMGRDSARQKDKRDKETKARVAEERLRKHAEVQYGERRLVKVDDDVYVAAGYGASNCILIEGSDGCVIIDAMDGKSSAMLVLEDFRSVTKKPISAIVLTHFHADHISGLEVFVAAASRNVQVVVHENFGRSSSSSSSSDSFWSDSTARQNRRISMDGTLIQESYAQVGTGIASTRSAADKYLWDDAFDAKKFPIRRFKDRLTINVAGLKLDLIHLPGESDDHIGVWWPRQETLFPGKNFYKSFPLMFGLGGRDSSRDCCHMRLQSLHAMLDLKPKVLIPQCTRPLMDQETIEDCLNAHIDAIKFVRDQTGRYMNKGLPADEIVQLVSLPSTLSEHPYLQEFHGTVENAVRGFFHHHLGWFSGTPVNLRPLAPAEEAKNVVALAGGAKKVLEVAKTAHDKFELQWALQLCQWLKDCKAEEKENKDLMSKILRVMASRESSAPYRNFLLTSAQEYNESGNTTNPDSVMMGKRVEHCSNLEETLSYLSATVDSQKALEVEAEVAIRLTDVEQEALLGFRNGTLHVSKLPASPSSGSSIDPISLTTTLTVWKRLISKEESLKKLHNDGRVKILPDIKKLSAFLDCFEL